MRLTAVVRGATTCRFSSTLAVSSLPSTEDCTSGSASITVSVPSNPSGRARAYSLYLTAAERGGSGTTMRELVVQRGRRSSAAAAPAITLDPASQSVFSGTRVTLTAAASGRPAPRVQWQVSTNGGAAWHDATGATGASWSFTPQPVANGYAYREYRAVFTNTAGSATTTAATLTISAVTAASGVTTKGSSATGSGAPAAPIVTTQPANQTVAIDQLVTLSAAASGNPTPSVQWQVSTNGGVSWAASGPSFAAISADSGYEYRAVFTNTAGSAISNPATLTVVPATSSNWSGYVATGETFSAVSGSFTVPAVTCAPGANTASSVWIGIDGVEDRTVEQEGVEADCDGGTASYFAWYEMYGDSDPQVDGGYAIPLSTSAHPVSPGDVISGSVSLVGSNWEFAMNDGQNWVFSQSVTSPTPPPGQSSAEWIVEDPEECSPCEQPPLTDFAPVRFSGATAEVNGQTSPISSFDVTALQIANGSTVLASPGPLDSTGEVFTDDWFANG